MLTDDVKKLKKDFKKRLVNDIEIFQKKLKHVNMLLNAISIFLKKKETKSINMVVNNLELF